MSKPDENGVLAYNCGGADLTAELVYKAFRKLPRGTKLDYRMSMDPWSAAAFLVSVPADHRRLRDDEHFEWWTPAGWVPVTVERQAEPYTLADATNADPTCHAKITLRFENYYEDPL